MRVALAKAAETRRSFNESAHEYINALERTPPPRSDAADSEVESVAGAGAGAEAAKTADDSGASKGGDAASEATPGSDSAAAATGGGASAAPSEEGGGQAQSERKAAEAEEGESVGELVEAVLRLTQLMPQLDPRGGDAAAAVVLERLYSMRELLSVEQCADVRLQLVTALRSKAATLPDVEKEEDEAAWTEKMGLLASADLYVRRCLEESPNQTNLLDLRARLALERKRPRLAIESWQSALAIEPEDSRGYTNLGTAFREAGNLTGAAAAYTKATELAPELSIAHFNLGVTHRDLGNYRSVRGPHNPMVLPPWSLPPHLRAIPTFYHLTLSCPSRLHQQCGARIVRDGGRQRPPPPQPRDAAAPGERERDASRWGRRGGR